MRSREVEGLKGKDGKAERGDELKRISEDEREREKRKRERKG